MSYLLSHWRGRLPLGISFWVNMIGLLIVISCLEYFTLSRVTKNPDLLINITLGSLVITRLIIYPWQLIGLFRAIEQDYVEYKNTLRTLGLQALALLTVVVVLMYSLQVVQAAFHFKAQVEYYARPEFKVAYSLGLGEDREQLLLTGGLDIGITNAVRSFVEMHPQIKSVVLQSGGGHIYEGRGLAKFFIEHGLDTYVFAECSSACTTAYIGGKQRYLGSGGKLGFHRYKLEMSADSLVLPIYDIAREQQRDLDLFESRGIGEVFLKQMFSQPANRIWFPDHAMLRDARLVHNIIP